MNATRSSQVTRTHPIQRTLLARALFLLPALLNCAGASDGSNGFVRRDSGGVEIVESGESASALQLGAILDEGLGVGLATPELARIVSAHLLADGRTVLTDDPSHRLVFIDPDGESYTTVGRSGDGPEEFRSFRGMWRCATDTLVVRSGIADVRILASDGTFANAPSGHRIRGTGYGVSTDCSRLVQLHWDDPDRLAERDSATFVWYDFRRDSVTNVARVPLQPRQVALVRGVERMPVPVPFSERPVAAVGGDLLYIGLGGAAEVRAYDLEGRLVRIYRWAAEGEELTAADRDRYETMRGQIDGIVGENASIDITPLSAFDLPTHKPVYTRLLVDDAGYLWVRKYPRNWEDFERISPALSEAESTWWIFAPSGRLLGTATTPRNFQIMDVRNGSVLGIRADSFNVPRPHVYPLSASLR